MTRARHIYSLQKKNNSHYGGQKIYVILKENGRHTFLNVPKEVLRHFGGYKGPMEVALIDKDKPPTIYNIQLVKKARTTKNKKSKEKLPRRESTQEEWFQVGQRVNEYFLRHKSVLWKYHIFVDDAKSEALCMIMDDWHGQILNDNYLQEIMRKIIYRLKFSYNDIDSLVIGKNYDYLQ